MTMEHRTELSRGDVRHIDRRRRLREIVSREYAICGIDLADQVQELVVTDHDGTVLARRGLKHTRAWQLTDALVWARQQARTAGFEDVVVACEPTGHRWRVVAEQCDSLELEHQQTHAVGPAIRRRSREQRAALTAELERQHRRLARRHP
jgi:transposase